MSARVARGFRLSLSLAGEEWSRIDDIHFEVVECMSPMLVLESIGTDEETGRNNGKGVYGYE